jgi:predicted amidohydrolase YtcJ
VSGLLVRNAMVEGRGVDVEIGGGRIVALRPAGRAGVGARAGGQEVLDAHGGALLPGLHDHHIHLAALAAAGRSVAAGPPAVRTAAELVNALRAADAALPVGEWLRATGYHESVAGEIDADWLDAVVRRRPVRVQHRSGAGWIVNGAAATAIDLDASGAVGVERDERGRATGRLYGGDGWLRQRAPAVALDFASVGRELAAYGVTAVTDATPMEEAADAELLADAVGGDGFPLRVVLMGGPGLPESAGAALERGPVKLVVGDHDLPALDRVAAAMAVARRQDRAVAVHCVTRAALILALAAWDEVGVVPGDRIEHGAVIPLEIVGRLVELGLTVVTQPGFVAERGDDYLADVDVEDQADLWRCGSLAAAGVPVGGSTDAPFGSPDPWPAVAAAIERRTGSGRLLGGGERLSRQAALELFLAPLAQPGGPPRRVVEGAAADLCLLDGPLDDVLSDPTSGRVVATVARGRVTFSR